MTSDARVKGLLLLFFSIVLVAGAMIALTAGTYDLSVAKTFEI